MISSACEAGPHSVAEVPAASECVSGLADAEFPGVLDPELAAAIDLDRLERAWQVLDDGGQEALRIAGGVPGELLGHHEPAARAGGLALLERPAVAETVMWSICTPLPGPVSWPSRVQRCA